MADQKYFRVIDANLNRAREGLRVIEDSARFVLKKEGAYKEARSLRHRLDGITRGIYPELLKQRDAASDAGRKIKEGGRDGFGSVISANFRRVEESLRVLEEYAKFISPGAAPAFKSIRFKAYSLEKKILV